MLGTRREWVGLQPMSENAPAGLESRDATDCTESDQSLDDRDARALCECMTTVPLGGDMFSVTTESGKEYTVDVREGRCTCPDHEHRDVRCKHIRRVEYATGVHTIPSWLSFAAEDPLLGEHADEVVTTSSKTIAIADGGSTDEECPDCAGDFPCFECYRQGAEFPD